MADEKLTPKQERDEAAEQRKALVRRASSDVHAAVAGMLNQGLTWIEITAVLDAAAASAQQQQALEQ